MEQIWVSVQMVSDDSSYIKRKKLKHIIAAVLLFLYFVFHSEVDLHLCTYGMKQVQGSTFAEKESDK